MSTDNKNTAPTVWHVQILPSGAEGGGAVPPSSWLLYRRLYGEGYNWRTATPEECAHAREHFKYAGDE